MCIPGPPHIGVPLLARGKVYCKMFMLVGQYDHRDFVLLVGEGVPGLTAGSLIGV